MVFLYVIKVKKTPFGAFINSFCFSILFLIGFLVGSQLNLQAILVSVLVFIVTFSAETLHQLAHLKRDIRSNRKTIPAVVGVKRSLPLFRCSLLLLLLFSFFLWRFFSLHVLIFLSTLLFSSLNFYFSTIVKNFTKLRVRFRYGCFLYGILLFLSF